MIPLFEKYTSLQAKLPYISIGSLPTKIQKLNELGSYLGLNHLYVKRDDLSGTIYGGNKVRKLEFILGQALHKKAKEVLTFGFAGSNHATATAIYARQSKLKPISILIPEPSSHQLRLSLLMSFFYGAELHHYPNLFSAVLGSVFQMARHLLKRGKFPFVIHPGGSSLIGTVGFVNAAFELRKQILKGEIPVPDLIYVALGSMGTAVGLILGLKVLKIKSHVIAVRVVDRIYANEKRMSKHFCRTNSFLHSLDTSFPICTLERDDVEIYHDYIGEKYSVPTKKGLEAVNLVKNKTGIQLDGTYTGKTFAAILDDAKKPEFGEKVILFWNTYNSRDFSKLLTSTNYRGLPKCFHSYFEKEIQPP